MPSSSVARVAAVQIHCAGSGVIVPRVEGVRWVSICRALGMGVVVRLVAALS